MAEIARIRWLSPPPTSVDESLVVYDDSSARLVVRTSRDGAPVIGTWMAAVAPDVLPLLEGQQREVDVRHPVTDDVVLAAERVAAEARETPVATATFHAAALPDGGVALMAVGGGTDSAEFELDADSVIVHLEKDGTEVDWRQMDRLETGFVSPEPEGLGGVGRAAEIPPGGYGAIALSGPMVDGAGAVTVELAGYLREALPERPSYERFHVRTAPVPLPG